MSQKENQILETFKNALPLLPERYLWKFEGYAERLVEEREEKEKLRQDAERAAEQKTA